ncbi:MAG TPA: MFS transporter [Candidatus Paceibacterota bacterium]|nr:MFS transporter [Candidatus Paceibacterota bacterium]
MKIKINVDLKIGRLVRNFVLIDLALFAGWGFLGPILPVFVIRNVAGATLTTVGIAAAIYLIVKSILQLPIANYIDRNHRNEGYHNDFFILVLGLLLASFAAFSYTLVKEVWQLYLVEMLHGIAFSLYTPSWSGIFSRHLDKDRISFDWSLDSTSVGLSAGITGLIGGIVAENFGFYPVFIMASAFSMIAVLVLVTSPDIVFPKSTTAPLVIKEQHDLIK